MGLAVYVMPQTAATPQAACHEPVPDVTHGSGGTCRKVGEDVWVRTEPSRPR
ncbi:hypothetical protein [Nonomuraea turcica]|uniref:hypothetical protein n=1 Tax=Nonomuraea sp. G32 TaxID=3067274 RepID=UPI00273A92EF|nr:hypothetical protein [Nonomuraea sp. G32]MDP4503378.1 hypothetical protein [Nonomuraea sp. G32]